MMRKSLMVVAVSAALTVAVFAAASTVQKTITVGDFAVKVSKALGKRASDPQSAVDALKSSGVELGKNLGAQLTEGEAARILRDLGVRVSTQHPESALSAAKADQLVNVVGQASDLAASVAPSDVVLPAECLNSPNRGTCVDCCKAIVGPILNAQGNPKDPGFICTVFCSTVTPPGHQSSPEPQP